MKSHPLLSRLGDNVASLTRTVNWAALIVGTGLFLMFQGEVDLPPRIAGATVLLALASLLIFTGSPPIPKTPAKTEEPIEEETETPAPVVVGGTVEIPQDTEMKRSRGRKKSPVMPFPPVPESMPMPDSSAPSDFPAQPSLQLGEQALETLPEGTAIAQRYVASGDAESEQESEIEQHVAMERERRAEILSGIERERRMRLAERRAAKARMWSEVEDGEDLANLLKQEGHGLTLYEEPENPDKGMPLGISYVRIDEERVLVVKSPLHIPEKENPSQGQEATAASPLTQPPLPPPGDFPPPPGMPPLPPPPSPNFED